MDYCSENSKGSEVFESMKGLIQQGPKRSSNSDTSWCRMGSSIFQGQR